MLTSERILNYPVISCGIDSCLARIIAWISDGGKARTLVCANPHSLVGAAGDDMFRKALLDAGMIVPDGAGIVLASRILRGRIRERITGSDVFHGVNEAMNREGHGSCFFLGSSEEILVMIREKMSKDFPNVRVAGTYSPPFTDEFTEEENRRIIEAVNAVKPDVLWVGMTAPKQEKWIYRNKNKLNVKFIGAIGGVFDFYSGNIRRNEYPWFMKHGLEWLPRLIQEPRRLWKRTFISAPVFFFLILKQKFLSR
ncbi:MAG: glycosyltransferase [Desulfobacteraceae bacterium]|nr:MAG: glycosyltransferase [Desulfobacteraceae bacterium]